MVDGIFILIVGKSNCEYDIILLLAIFFPFIVLVQLEVPDEQRVVVIPLL
jgi:hypothetical protein